jgi:hypothetical protein
VGICLPPSRHRSRHPPEHPERRSKEPAHESLSNRSPIGRQVRGENAATRAAMEISGTTVHGGVREYFAARNLLFDGFGAAEGRDGGSVFPCLTRLSGSRRASGDARVTWSEWKRSARPAGNRGWECSLIATRCRGRRRWTWRGILAKCVGCDKKTSLCDERHRLV